MPEGSKDITLEEINRWIESVSDPAADLAARAFMNARAAHVGGELPKYLRGEWHNLPKDYREFLASVAQLALTYSKTA